MRILLIIIMVFTAANIWAQPKSQKIKVSGGEALNDIVDKQLQYAFDDFTDGVVLHNNGKMSKTKFNYSYLLSEMQYVDLSTKDTLALIRDSGITVISIGGRKFIPGLKDKEFIELLNDGNISLGVKRSSKVISMGKEGAYGTLTTTASASSLKTLTLDISGNEAYSMNMEQIQKLSVTDHMQVNLENFYYLVSLENSKPTFINNIKTFLKVYPKDKAVAIEQYANENKINFKKEEDLLKLTDYCNQL